MLVSCPIGGKYVPGRCRAVPGTMRIAGACKEGMTYSDPVASFGDMFEMALKKADVPVVGLVAASYPTAPSSGLIYGWGGGPNIVITWSFDKISHDALYG